MEKYIGKCLDSLLIPEFDQVEVLVVNDGSKDRSSEIAHEYAKRYPESIRVIDKENGNYGSCINAALPLATGRYVKVLDADDTFDTKAFSEYVRALPQRNEDVLVNDYVMVFEDKSDLFKPSFKQLGYIAGKTYNFDQSFKYISADLHMHCIAYKTGKIRSLNYRQTEGVSYTDNEWIYGPIALAESFAFIEAGYLYRYLLGRAGQTVDPKQILSRIKDHFEVIKAKAYTYNKIKVDKLRNKYLETQLFHHAKLIYFRVIDSKNNVSLLELAQFDQQLKKLCPYLFDILDNAILEPRIPYKYIHKFRATKYSPKFRISPLVKLSENIIHNISKIKTKLLRK